ncbi:NADH dehydrogenase [ubiquinone] iron-sulfur protein 5-like [Anneissia japonica]|uniref:NADH dehydrogenase [ubiquinone] iron-sulfur protein 5-like n=1 Tax=Anneissia japonica TaxID=1529436 RepID=UPI001425AC65|nr:NADH dehydrogenase [ubiquinone] iron-sulfur protein 5-like [Anneissia japonica]
MEKIPKHSYDLHYAGFNVPKTHFSFEPKCADFERDWMRCAKGLGYTRAFKECDFEYSDFIECVRDTKKNNRYIAIKKQRAKLIKEGKYTPPPYPTEQLN